jgi:hypothetical protein
MLGGWVWGAEIGRGRGSVYPCTAARALRARVRRPGFPETKREMTWAPQLR